jgi:4-hydroxybutyrate CoA-transferase
MLPSTFGDGSVSNIKARLDEGAVVSIPRSFADYVVTEYGVAQLAGKTLRERAEELIRVAHPDFHDQLREAAREIL